MKSEITRAQLIVATGITVAITLGGGIIIGHVLHICTLANIVECFR